MANDFLKPEQIAAQGLGLLRRELILPRIVQRMGLSDFRGAKNDTVNVRVPTILTAREYEWRTRNADIVTDDLEEKTIPVSLDKHVYSAVRITDEELTLDILNWGVQVAQPQIIAVAEKLESYIADAMTGATYAAADIAYIEDETHETDPFYNALVDARKALNAAHVPATNRYVILGSDVEAAALKEPSQRRADQSGSTDALTSAIIDRRAGFTILGNIQSVPADFALAFHTSAFVFANVAPLVPDGVSAGAGIAFEGFAMRWIRDYYAPRLYDRSVYSAFAGAASVEDGRDDHGELTEENVRAVKITFTPAGS